MSPTIQTNGRHDGRAARSTTTEKRSDLVCKVKYNNTLPDIPFDPKSIVYPFDAHRYVQYTPSSLERSYKFELLTEHDLGVPIDLINPDTYRVDPDADLEPEDEYLLEDESNAPLDAKRSRHHNKNVSWLRKTEYISTEYNRFHQSALKSEARLGYSIKKHMTEEVLYKDRDSQIKAIKETFDFAKAPITQHYSKPGVSAVEILPMFPDFEMWKQPCAQVIFDSDPAQKGRSAALQTEEMSQAMIRGMVDEQGEQFVGYFLPTAETMEKHKRDLELGVDYEDDEEYDYVMAGEYNWNVKNKASRGYEENYFFILKDDGIYYNELETRVRLSKKRRLGASATTAKSRLVVKHRPLNVQELRQQHDRLVMLDAPGEEEDDELERQLNKSDDDEPKQAASPAGSGGGDQTPNHRADSLASGSPRSVKSEGSRKRSHNSSPAGSIPGSPTSDAGSARGRSQVTSGRVSPRSQMTSARGSPKSHEGSVNGSPASRARSASPAGSASPARSEGSGAGSRDGSPARSPDVHNGSITGSPQQDGSDGGSQHGSSAPNSPGGSGGSHAGSAPNSPGRASSAGGYDSEAERLRNEEAEIFGSDGDD